MDQIKTVGLFKTGMWKKTLIWCSLTSGNGIFSDVLLVFIPLFPLYALVDACYLLVSDPLDLAWGDIVLNVHG